jgi:hypothetical protein
MLTTIAEIHLHEAKRFVRATKNEAIAEPYGYTVEYGTFDPETGKEQTRWHSEPLHGDTRTDAEASMLRLLDTTFTEAAGDFECLTLERA